MGDRSRQQYHQDYIARIRYSNALPPPPCPPKLLEIPNTGLASGQYTNAGFASRLAREQPPNIEADAELGMPIDLVGIPGVFDNDESAISAMDHPPPLHPADRLLMRPHTALGKKDLGAAGTSFLRRTEYTTSYTKGGSNFESSTSTNTMRTKTKRRRQDISKDDPVHISRSILKGFNLAYPSDAYNGPDSEDKLRGAEITSEERQAWKAPKHPSNTSLTLVDSYPLVPDWDAIPDMGAYMMYKFQRPPIEGPYDPRLDVAILRPAGQSVEDNEMYVKEEAAHKEDPTRPPPSMRYHFEFFLATEKDKVRGIKRNFATYDPDNEDEIPFDIGNDEDGNPRKYFKYENVRMYETAQQAGDMSEAYGDQIAIALHDPETHSEDPLRPGKLQKAAYFYPIGQTTKIAVNRPHKKTMMEEVQKVDIIETVAREANENEKQGRESFLRKNDAIEVEF